MKEKLIEFYKEWYNSTLTDKEMADQYEMKELDVHNLLIMGANYIKEREDEQQKD